jgi:CubicO group peptidase (beta-lactamase class C family)
MQAAQFESIALVGDSEIHGSCDERFASVKEAFVANLNTGKDIGASVALFIDGAPVVDLWGGYFDGTYTRPWERDTIVQTFSTTKTMTALCALLLADRGEIDLHAPVAKYWPEFAAEGKSAIEVRHVLGHTSGVPGWTEPVSVNDLYDTMRSTEMLGRQAPWWTPGTAAGYHCYSIGHLIGEIVRRVTGKTLGQFFAEEIAEPLGADFHIGTGPEHDRRVSLLIPGSKDEPKGDRLVERVLLNPHVTPKTTWTLPWRRAEIGGANGHGNARAIAAAQSVLANGGAFGKTLMSDKGREKVLELQFEGRDLVMGVPIAWGMGYALRSPLGGLDFAPRVAYWGGNGGSMAFVDLDAHMSFGYAQNRWIRGPYELDRCRVLLTAVYDSLRSRRR